VYGVAVAPDGSWLVTTSDDQTVRVWDATTNAARSVLEGHTRRVRAVAIACDGTWLASAGDDRLVLVWNVGRSGGQPAPVPPTAVAAMRVDAAPSAVCCRTDGRGLFIGGNRGVYAFTINAPSDGLERRG
jgi:WD40 repeat protein